MIDGLIIVDIIRHSKENDVYMSDVLLEKRCQQREMERTVILQRVEREVCYLYEFSEKQSIVSESRFSEFNKERHLRNAHM